MGKIIEGKFPYQPDDRSDSTRKERREAVREKDELLALFEVKAAIDRVRLVTDPLLQDPASRSRQSDTLVENFYQKIATDPAAVKRLCAAIVKATDENVRSRPAFYAALAKALDEHFSQGPHLARPGDSPETE